MLGSCRAPEPATALRISGHRTIKKAPAATAAIACSGLRQTLQRTTAALDLLALHVPKVRTVQREASIFPHLRNNQLQRKTSPRLYWLVLA